MSQTVRSISLQRGYALITTILFLVMLTVVALAVLKSSGLEARMSNNTAYHTQSLESSETSRRTVDALIDANVFYRGWPNSSGIGGAIPAADFDPTVTALILSAAACPLSPSYSGTTAGYNLCYFGGTSAPRNWFDHNSECGEATVITPCPLFNPESVNEDATFTQPFTYGSGSSGSGVTKYETSVVGVYKLAVTLAAGAGSQQAAGYLGLGRAAAAGGGNIYFYINGHGRDYSGTPQASVDSSAVFRDTIRD
jgi:Tfp pilus assembly protein PilX